jgi:hypothetical protein
MRTVLQLLLLTLLLTAASCKKSGDIAGNQNGMSGDPAAAGGGTAATPPFATKEPERYQATRIITTSGDSKAAAEGQQGGQTFIARDGERRREDYEAAAGQKISYLQLPEGSYVLLPAKKLYAELKAGGTGAGDEREMSAAPDFAPEKLLNETRPESVYEKLGAEDVNGRATQKYRVTVKGKTGASREVTTESIVWVDERLGMPVKTETTSTGGAAASGSKVSMELRDIRETVDASLFELPSDFRKVEARELYAEVKTVK